jgi:hypothetical protein
MPYLKQQKKNKKHYKSIAFQKGQTLTEYLVIAVALLTVWGIIDVSMNLLREHHDEYTWSITQPFF